MKNFYSVEPKHDFKSSSSKYENVEYDINTLIREQAELYVNADDDWSDEEWESEVDKMAIRIKDELMFHGIWKNEFGQPVFLYCY